MRRQYVFDKASFSFKKVTHTFWSFAVKIAKYGSFVLLITAFNYFLFSLFISTDTEKRLSRENNMYEKVYDQMLQRELLIGDVVAGLQVKDNQIYNDIFNADAPGMDPVSIIGSIAETDSLQDKDLVEYTRAKVEGLEGLSSEIEARFSRLLGPGRNMDSLPPLSIPLRTLSYAQVGASIGEKVNPFYKVPVQHNGLDLIAPQGNPVLSSGPGFVSDVITSRKGQGNVVEITHACGYVTRYAHLADIQVRKGNQVVTGTCIGYVGISGNSFAPHLHYEVLRNGEYLDPVNFFFASVPPDEYMNMLYMSVSTGQSMD